MENRPPSSRNMMLEQQCDFLDLPGSMQRNIQETPGMVQYVQETEQLCSDFACNEVERREGFATNDYVANDEEASTEQNELGKTNDRFPWPRVKWTEKMVRTLITILSYVGEESSAECTGSWKKRVLLFRKIGKWRCVSRVMIERGYHVSPQQCEDKFNNLNKTYKRLNELLGRGTSCKVVENPKLLGAVNVSDKAKEVKRILASKHLFFEEMCSYHNGNRLFLPHDPDVVQSLVSVLRNEGTCKARSSNQLSGVGGEFNALNDTTEAKPATLEFAEVSGEWLKQMEEIEVADLGNPLVANQMFDGQAQYNQTNFNPTCPKIRSLYAASQFDITDLNLTGLEVRMLEDRSQFDQIDLDPSSPVGENAIKLERQLMKSQLHQLEVQKSLIKGKMLKLQGDWLELEQINLAKDLKLQKMRQENKRLKLANEHGSLELKRKIMASKQRYA